LGARRQVEFVAGWQRLCYFPHIQE